MVGRIIFKCVENVLRPRANGAERRSGSKPGARVLIPPGYLHPGNESIRWVAIGGWSSSLTSKIWRTVMNSEHICKRFAL
jgi:hypothetical protein